MLPGSETELQPLLQLLLLPSLTATPRFAAPPFH